MPTATCTNKDKIISVALMKNVFSSELYVIRNRSWFAFAVNKAISIRPASMSYSITIYKLESTLNYINRGIFTFVADVRWLFIHIQWNFLLGFVIGWRRRQWYVLFILSGIFGATADASLVCGIEATWFFLWIFHYIGSTMLS